MSLADSLILRVNKLEEENESLRQQVQTLNELLAPANPPPFGLTHQEAAIWTVLERRRAVPTATLIAAAEFGGRSQSTQIRVMMLRVRAKVEPHGWVIRSRWGWGYELTKTTPEVAA